MSHKAMSWAIDQCTGSPARKAVLMNLADRADEAWSCFPGQKRIATDTELGERTVRRALDDLETDGHILRFHRRRKDGSWTSDRYVLAGYVTDPDAVRLLADVAPPAALAAGTESDAESLLAGAGTSGQSGRRPERPSATVADDPAAAAAGHEPPGSNHHSTTPLPSGGAPAEIDGDQLPLVDAPAEPAKVSKRKTRLPADWTLSDELRERTAERYPHVDIDREAEAFRNHFHGTGRQWERWDLAWWNWVGKVPKRTTRSGRPGPYRNPQTPQGQDDTQAAWESWGTNTGGRA